MDKNNKIEQMEEGELWKEIISVINATNLTETDKKILLKMIQELRFRE